MICQVQQGLSGSPSHPQNLLRLTTQQSSPSTLEPIVPLMWTPPSGSLPWWRKPGPLTTGTNCDSTNDQTPTLSAPTVPPTPCPSFQPSDICFYQLQGREYLLVADELGDALHVLHVEQGQMKWVRCLAWPVPLSHSPQHSPSTCRAGFGWQVGEETSSVFSPLLDFPSSLPFHQCGCVL